MGREGRKERAQAGRGATTRARTDAIPAVLLGGGRGDGVAVVPAEEDDGALEGGGEVEAGVGVPLTGRSLSEVTDDDPVGVGPLGRVGCPHRCRSRDRRLPALIPSPRPHPRTPTGAPALRLAVARLSGERKHLSRPSRSPRSCPAHSLLPSADGSSVLPTTAQATNFSIFDS